MSLFIIIVDLYSLIEILLIVNSYDASAISLTLTFDLIKSTLRGYYTRMCCLRLTKCVQHNKHFSTQDRTTRSIMIAKALKLYRK